MADSLSRFINSLTETDPQLRGQKLWAMFAIALFLVAAMNWYAMMREPETITASEMVEYNNEVVNVEGVLLSWVEDPYGQGEDRTDLIIQDSTGVVEVRWYRAEELPVLGTVITAMGDVIEYEGRLWLQALGAGAVRWSADDLPEITSLGIADVAREPAEYLGKTIQLTGFVSETLNPSTTFNSAYLGDHPTYGNSEHQMHITIHSSTNAWIEASSEVQVTGVLEYEQRDLRYSLHIIGSEITYDRNAEPQVTQLVWSDSSSWMYSIGNLVSITGNLVISDDLSLTGPNGLEICLVPSEEFSQAISSGNMNGSTISIQGRLVWSEISTSWCIDMDDQLDSTEFENIQIDDILTQLSVNPVDVLNSDSFYTINAYAKYPIEPGVDDKNSAIADSPSYSPGWKGVDISIPGPRSDWIEAGQAIRANVSVEWSDSNMRAKLIVHDYTLIGQAPGPTSLLWTDSIENWQYEVNTIVSLSGVLTTVDDQLVIQQNGGTKTILVNPKAGDIGTNSIHENRSLDWNGRLVENYDSETMGMRYMLNLAYVEDSDSDGLANSLEIQEGFNPNNEDSDDDGISDLEEYQQAE